jgi:two-component system chemotaxis sensor kinase CheA
MTEPDDAFEQRLLAIFAEEARGHLAQIDAALCALEQTGAPLLAGAVLDALHTLKGAARSVELGDLEYLCHSLEYVFAASNRSGAVLSHAQFERVRQALDLAGILTSKPAGRTRNQALAMMGQLDGMARHLESPASPAVPLESEIHPYEHEQNNS